MNKVTTEGSVGSLQEVEKDAAAVEEALLAFVAQARPDNESRASQLGAAQSLIAYARSDTSEEPLQFSDSVKQPRLDAYHPEVLRSCSALQPVLGKAEVLDAFQVLRALHCRMQRLQATAAGQPEPCEVPQGDLAASEIPQGRSSASNSSSASESAAAQTAGEAPGMKAEESCAACVSDVLERSALSCSQQEATPASKSRTHDASASSERTAPTRSQARIPEQLGSEQRRQLSDSAARPLQCAAKADAGEHRGRAQQGRAHLAHDVSALRGEALRQGDLITDLRMRLRSTEEDHAAQVDLLTAVHTDQEALIADLSEQLSTCRARCAELKAMLAELCGPPHAAASRLGGHPTRSAELQAAEACAAELTTELAEAKERLAAQSVVLDEREAALQECEGQRTHAEAQAAVQHHQQQGITARLENSEADMAAKLALAKDQNTALRIACGELRQLLAMQKAAAAERECEAARHRAATSACALPAGMCWPSHCDEAAQRSATSLPAAAETTLRHKATQHEALTEEAAISGAERDAAESTKHIYRLRAALAASERQRERQAASHKQELEALRTRLDQAQKAELAPATPDIRAGRPSQGSAESSCGYSESAHLYQLRDNQPLQRQDPSPTAQASDACAPDTPYRLRPTSVAAHPSSAERKGSRQEGAAQQACTGCQQWQRRCAQLQRQREADAESAHNMRTEAALLTQQLSEAQHEAASLAADMAQSQRTCMHLQQQLILLQAQPSCEQQHAVIPLGEYLNISGDSLLCPEQIHAISLGSSEARSTDSQDWLLAQQLSTAASSKKASARMASAEPVYRREAHMHSSAASMANSEASQSSGHVCHGPADVDSMLAALEDVLQPQNTQHTGAADCARGMERLEAENDTELQSAREEIAAALQRRGELRAELARVHAELVAARAQLADVQACQRPPEVLKLRQEICRLRAALPAKSGAQHLKQWELAVEEAAAGLHSTEEQMQEATRQLLALQACCTEAAAEVHSQESAIRKTKGELDLVHKKLQEEQGKLAEVAKEARQLEAAAVAAKAEADTAASQCLDQSKRTAGLLAEQQDLQKVLDRKRTAAQAQEAALMRDKQELSRVQAALEGVLRVKATAEQELQDAQRIASSAASQTAAAQEALEETKAGLCKVQAEKASAREHVSCLVTDLERLGRERAEASAELADVSAALLEAQVLAKEESRKLQSLREQVAAASREAGISDAKSAQAQRQLAELQQAINAAQHSVHSSYCTQPGPCNMHAPDSEASEQMTPTGRRLALWHEHRNGTEQSPEGSASRLEGTQLTTQHGCVQPSECTSSHGGSPIRLTAGHWQFHPSSASKDDVHSTLHAQHAARPLPGQEPTVSALHGKLCSAEAEVARLRAQVQAQHTASSRSVPQTPQTSPGEPGTPFKVGDQHRGDNFRASWAQERDKNPFTKKTTHGSVAPTAAVAAPHAELASVSAQVAQQRSVLQHLTSQVLQAQAELAGADATKEQLRNVRRHLALLESQLQLHASS